MKKINDGSVQDLADALRRDHDPGSENEVMGRTVLMIGAGCSYSAGIPLAKDIAQSLICQLALAYRATKSLASDPVIALKALIQKGHFRDENIFGTVSSGAENISWSSVYDILFTDHYNSPKEVRKIFSRIFENSGNSINWTHVCIGELVRSGYVSTVLSTNFDQLALEGMASAGRIPIVADGLEFLGRITGESRQPQLVQIHGSRHTYHLRNSKADTEELSNDHGARHAIDELFRTASVFIAVGYGGREKGIMDLLIEAGRRYPDTRIFWCSYNESANELPSLVKQFLNTSRYANVIHGYDSDSLFDSILGAMGIDAPQLIKDPLYVVRKIAANISFTEDSSIAEKIRVLQSKTLDLRIAEAHMTALSPIAVSHNVELMQAQKMAAVGQLAGGIAHDFNNVLTAIIMASDLLLTNHRPSDPSFLDIMNIKQNANRAASLVRQLLAFSRKQTLRPEVLNLTDVLADLRMLLARLVGNNIKLKVDHGRDLWPVKVDIGQFEQVVVNLAVNARDAMPTGGALTVRTKNVTGEQAAAYAYHRELGASDYILVEVEDSGTGIAPDVLENIFEPFFTTKEVGKGTGLGLSMVYGIIKQTGGHIFCESEIGRGTTFRIFLPRHIAEVKSMARPATEDTQIDLPSVPSPPPSPKAVETARDLSGSATVLLVEDDDAVRMGGMRALTSRGYQVHEASSGLEALKIFSKLKGRVDIVVSDVVMPDMDGPQLLIQLRSLQPEIKVIFISGYAQSDFESKINKGENFRFLSKPFSLKQLATAVKDVLEG